jgi:GNAT superfamily N-acetyltransferase
VPVTIDVCRARDPRAVSRLLRALPDWFGIETAIDNYVRDAQSMDSYLARLDAEVSGVALVKSHFPETSELHLIAVAPAHHRQGIGGRLLRAIEEDLRSDGVQLLIVHTVGPSYENAAYASTREFYKSSGFLPLQEFTNIDWDGPTLVLVKPLD